MNTNELSEAEQATLVDLLSKIVPGFLPYDIFVQLARLVVLSIIEFVPLRHNDRGGIEVLLLSRGPYDPIWPNELHVPGTVILPTDTEDKIYRAFDRILVEELKATKVSDPHFVGGNLHKSNRGMEQAQIFWVEVLDEPKVGKFYPIDDPPVELMESQRNFIKLAAENFQKSKT